MTTAVPIIRYPNPKLREESKDVIFDDKDRINYVIDQLSVTMKSYGGLGLSASQISIPEKIAIVMHNNRQYVLINPKVLEYSTEKETIEEGCLSFPGIGIRVERPYWIKIITYDENAVEHEISAEGILAREILHEMDHFNGKLFIDYLSPIKRDIILRKLKKHKMARY